MPGSGKTTLGKKLADYLDYPFLDLDQLIESRERISVAEIFAQKGEDHFRLCEHNALKSYISDDRLEKPGVLSLGGGTPCFHNNSELIRKHGISIFLNTPLSLIAERMELAGEISKRPLMAKAKSIGIREELGNKYTQRLPFFEKSHIKIKGDESLEFISSLIVSFIATRQ